MIDLVVVAFEPIVCSPVILNDLLKLDDFDLVELRTSNGDRPLYIELENIEPMPSFRSNSLVNLIIICKQFDYLTNQHLTLELERTNFDTCWIHQAVMIDLTLLNLSFDFLL